MHISIQLHSVFLSCRTIPSISTLHSRTVFKCDAYVSILKEWKTSDLISIHFDELNPNLGYFGCRSPSIFLPRTFRAISMLTIVGKFYFSFTFMSLSTFFLHALHQYPFFLCVLYVPSNIFVTYNQESLNASRCTFCPREQFPPSRVHWLWTAELLSSRKPLTTDTVLRSTRGPRLRLPKS